MLNVLFVDDEPKVLDGLRRMLRPLRREWDMAFAGGGREALAMLQQNRFDVIVSDVRMPEMNGVDLLHQVREIAPHTVRIILTGQSSQEALLKAVRVAHRQLSKPCDPEVLREAVRRSCALRQLLGQSTLLTLALRLETIPSLPSQYFEVVRELESSESSLQKVGQIVAKDAGMSAKILQMIRSAFFCQRTRELSPEEAVVYLGAETTKLLVLAANIFSHFEPALVQSFPLDALWAHSQATSQLAKLLAKTEQAEPLAVAHAAMAGLLHDIGKLILAGYLPDQYRSVLIHAREERILLHDAERQIFGATHAELGAYVLGLWGLPEGIVEAVAWHHNPDHCPETAFSPLTAVHVASALLHEGVPETAWGPWAPLCNTYLNRLELAGRLEAWRDLRNRSDRGESL
ncbi:MAG TPA: response regulator [Gemmataceae bacterium]|nr:response regulator [Gemmataceae bacterium]